MAYAIYKQGTYEHRLTEFTIDSAADVASLPKHPEVAFGSTAIDSSSRVYMLFPSNEWKEI